VIHNHVTFGILATTAHRNCKNTC